MTGNKKRLARQKQRAWQKRQQQAKKRQQQAKKAAAVENSWASCQKMNQKKDGKNRLTNRIVKCSSPTKRKTPTASSKM